LASVDSVTDMGQAERKVVGMPGVATTILDITGYPA
jgi:hypothetical protein